jgi:hypothetical protein
VKCLRGGEPLGVEAGLEPCEIVTEGRHAALGGDPGASEGDNPASLAEELSGTRRQHTFHPADPSISLMPTPRHANTAPPGTGCYAGREQLRGASDVVATDVPGLRDLGCAITIV